MDHENSQQAREFLRSYVNGNRKLITVWLDGSGNAEDVGSHLLCIMLERLAIDEKPDLSGIAGGHVIKLSQTVPGGSLALGRLWRPQLDCLARSCSISAQSSKWITLQGEFTFSSQTKTEMNGWS